jgi:ABC-type nitrate/sulfonate/bicarbonate transport system permease component
VTESPVTVYEPAADNADAGVAPKPPARRSYGSSPVLLGAIGLVGLVLLFEILPRIGVLPHQFFPTSSEIGAALLDQFADPGFWTALLDTIYGWALGLVIAAVAGVVLGIVIGSSHFLRELTASTIEFLRPIPSVALIPLAVLLFGVQLESTLLLVVYASFWQILIQVLYGVGDVDTVAQDTAKSYGLGTLARVRYVTWPTSLPYVITGLRLGAAVALILAVTAQLVIGTPGLGREISLAQSGGAVTAMYAFIVTAGLLGVLINLGMRALERRALAWHSSVRGEVAV